MRSLTDRIIDWACVVFVVAAVAAFTSGCLFIILQIGKEMLQCV